MIPATGGVFVRGDARALPLPAGSVDLVVTSPPYWKKLVYGVAGEIGRETTPEVYVAEVVAAMAECRRVLRPTGSVFLNVGDSYHNKSLAGIPARLHLALAAAGWHVRNEITWVKDRGKPEPAKDRLACRREPIFHLTAAKSYYYDLYTFSLKYGSGANPGDVWAVPPCRSLSGHPAPFPPGLVERAVTLACPERVCDACGRPWARAWTRNYALDPARRQTGPALARFAKSGLGDDHLMAIRAVGISDAGKGDREQGGLKKNDARIAGLAAEAKRALGGYFREFLLFRPEPAGWAECGCGAGWRPGVVLDPFCGTGTTVRAAVAMGRRAVGVDLMPPEGGVDA